MLTAYIRTASDLYSRPTTRNTDTFGYNERGEVVFSRRGAEGAEDAYAYDSIGNLLLSACNAATNTYTANNINQYTSIQNISAPLREISHDLDGNMTSDGVFTYTYDSENRLASVSSNGIVLVANEYDYRGRRIRKTTPTTETTFVYDGWNLIHETVSTISGATTNTTEIQYFWGADLSNTLQGAGGVGGLLAVSRNGDFYFPTYDNNGNITKYIDEGGNIVAAYEYDAFGRTISQSGSMADIFRHRFSTKYYDVESRLYYYGYRFYSPSLMRWLNRDPLEEEGGLNLYGFCKNSSFVTIDLLGLLTTKESFVYMYDLTTGIVPGTILASTDASAVVQVGCTCGGHDQNKWVLDSINIEFILTIHHQNGGYGTNIKAALFAYKSEMEHVNDIKFGIRNYIVPSVLNLEMGLRMSTYDSECTCLNANKKLVWDLVRRELDKICQQSVDNRDNSGSHTWRGW